MLDKLVPQLRVPTGATASAGRDGSPGHSQGRAPGVAHRGRLLEVDAGAAAHGVFDGLLCLVV